MLEHPIRPRHYRVFRLSILCTAACAIPFIGALVGLYHRRNATITYASLLFIPPVVSILFGVADILIKGFPWIALIPIDLITAFSYPVLFFLHAGFTMRDKCEDENFSAECLKDNWFELFQLERTWYDDYEISAHALRGMFVSVGFLYLVTFLLGLITVGIVIKGMVVRKRENGPPKFQRTEIA